MLAKTPLEMEENTETFLDALNAFERKPSREIPSELEQLLCRIAHNGEPLFPWNKLKPLIVIKLENVIQEYIQANPSEEVPMLPNVENVKFDDMRERLLRAINAFNSAPFTMQRLCELLTQPKRYYQRSDKFMRGVEKNVQVVSTITPAGKRITHSCEVRNHTLLMNGIPSDTHTTQTTATACEDSQTASDPALTETPIHASENGTTPLSCRHVSSLPTEVGEMIPSPALLGLTAGVVTSTSERTACLASEPVLPPVSDDVDGGCKEASEHNEATASKPAEEEERTGTSDSDDSDGNKVDPDQDSCSSMDSADSGDSSPDSVLPPSGTFFKSLTSKEDNNTNPESTALDPKAPEAVGSSDVIIGGVNVDEMKSTSDSNSEIQPDQSHSSISALPAEDQAPSLVGSEAATKVDQSEETPVESEKPITESSNQAEPAAEESVPVSQSEIPSEFITAGEEDTPMEQE